ncbi:MAG: hypothetical protein RMY63_10535 [Nostoc sp. ChiQUE01b]|nr:hypothetical protein [Nostoc sp. ChiQUE01b]
MGTVLEQSGDGLVEKASGSSLCRISLWQYVLTGVETGRLPENELTGELINFARCYQAKEIFYNSLQIARVKLVRKLKSLV